VVFTPTDATTTESCLSTDMLHMSIGNDIRLRIITRPPELQKTSEQPSPQTDLR